MPPLQPVHPVRVPFLEQPALPSQVPLLEQPALPSRVTPLEQLMSIAQMNSTGLQEVHLVRHIELLGKRTDFRHS